MALRQADRLESNNPKAYGIVKATEVSGFRSIQSLTELYAIPDCILSVSGDNQNSDAIGQKWYVVSEGKDYELHDWDNRNSETGWKIATTGLDEADREKLDGIQEGAEVNVIDGIKVAGTDLPITDKKVDILEATELAPGVMSVEDKKKVNKLKEVISVISESIFLPSYNITSEQYEAIKTTILEKNVIIVSSETSGNRVCSLSYIDPETEAITLVLSPMVQGDNGAVGTKIVIQSSGAVSIENQGGIPQANAIRTGGIRVGFSDTGKKYSVQLDEAGKAFVEVPWTETTAYRPMGSKATLDEVIALTNAKIGDVWYITSAFTLNGVEYPAGSNVVCIKATTSSSHTQANWGGLGIGATFDMSHIAVCEKIDDPLEIIYKGNIARVINGDTLEMTGLSFE